MSDEAGFLTAIAAEPTDDLCRLAYLDLGGNQIGDAGREVIRRRWSFAIL